MVDRVYMLSALLHNILAIRRRDGAECDDCWYPIQSLLLIRDYLVSKTEFSLDNPVYILLSATASCSLFRS